MKRDKKALNKKAGERNVRAGGLLRKHPWEDNTLLTDAFPGGARTPTHFLTCYGNLILKIPSFSEYARVFHICVHVCVLRPFSLLFCLSYTHANIQNSISYVS